MRSEWTSYKIGEIFELVNGYAFKSGDFISSGIPVLKIKNVKPNNVVLDDLSYVSVEVASRRNDKAIRRGDILITMSGNRFDGSKDTWVGKVAYFDISGHYMLNQRVGVLRPREGVVIDRKCAAYFLSSDDYQKLFISIATSSGGQANLSPAQILGEQLHLPPIEEQARISELLGGLDDRITLLRETNATLEAIAQALFKSWFVDFDPVRAKAEGRQPEAMDATTAALFPDSFEESELGLVPKGWVVATMADISTVGIGKTPPRKESQWFSENARDVRWVSIRDMGASGVYASQTSEYLTPEAVEKFNVRRVPDNTVLMSFKMTIGRVAITDGEMTTNEAIAHFRLDTGSPLSAEYLYLYLRQFDFSRLSSTSSIADAVNSKTVREIPVLVPCKQVAEAFQDQISTVFAILKKNEQQAQTLTQLRDTLLPRLISGQLRLPEAEATVEEVL